MRLFISTEAHISVGPIISGIIQKINERLGVVEVKDYSNCIDSFGIIINCFDDQWKSLGYGKVRKHISYKSRNADVRLNIPYNNFIIASKKDRECAVKKVIIESIQFVNEKINKKEGCFFDGNKLIDYVKAQTQDIG